MLFLVYEVEEYIITHTVFFFKEKPWISEGEAAADHPYPCCFLETDPSSSLNSGANLHFHSVLSKTIYSMENRHSRQNKRETTSEGEVECSAIYDRTNYHIWVFLAGRVTAWCSLTHLWRITLCYVMELSVIQKATVSVLLFCFPFLVMSCLITFFSIQQPFFYLFKFKKEPE